MLMYPYSMDTNNFLCAEVMKYIIVGAYITYAFQNY